jgi:corrinoid protein of di/trimethylamine methyltransferase
MNSDAILKAMAKSVEEGESEQVESLVGQGLSAGLPPLTLLDQGFIPGMEEVGKRYADGDAFLPELVQAADVMRTAMSLLEPHLAGKGQVAQTKGRVLLGTVEGDIHDIGKSIVGAVLSANGFSVKDLGTSVSADRFVAETESYRPQVVGLSALITTTMGEQKKVIERLAQKGLRESCRVIVGGAPVTAQWAQEIGADGYGEDAMDAVRLCRSLLAARA